MEVTENDQDVVILKSDGIPTYHFAARCGRPSDGHDRRCPRRGWLGNAAGTPAAVPRDGLEGAEVRTHRSADEDRPGDRRQAQAVKR